LTEKWKHPNTMLPGNVISIPIVRFTAHPAGQSVPAILILGLSLAVSALTFELLMTQ